LPFFGLSRARSKERSKVRAPALGEAVAHLPWLSPAAASLVAWARLSAPAAWQESRADPGAVLFLVRHSWAARASPGVFSFANLLHEPGVLDEAVRALDRPGAGFVDWNRPEVRRIYQTALAYAHAARALAERGGLTDPDAAWVAGLVAPLGWLGVAAADPVEAGACLADPGFPLQPRQVQERRWGFDQSALARRLSRRWQLPTWLAVVAGHLDLPVQSAQLLGADPELFRVVQRAVGLVQAPDGGLRLGVEGARTPTAELSISDTHLSELIGPVDSSPTHPVASWQAPRSTPLLRDLLMLAAEKRRLASAPGLESLEQDVDHLHEALQAQHASEEDRLRAAKLAALAELAAGAGHEINNPLAVISGQAQYLAHHEPDPNRQRSLAAIISQTQRIHTILHDLMLFARPPKPRKEPVDAAALTGEVTAALTDLALERQVQLSWVAPEQPLTVYSDSRQLRTALSGLVRNAIEAAPAEGWARVRVQQGPFDAVEWVVEDSGSGPAPEQREHLFDPFYSGRQAGRGRGLGLPTAWRLAREHGGDVRFENVAGGPTRFILSLPRGTGTNGTAHHSTDSAAEPLATAPPPDGNGHPVEHGPVRADL
jgi:signal transduction histidine kinase